MQNQSVCESSAPALCFMKHRVYAASQKTSATLLDNYGFDNDCISQVSVEEVLIIHSRLNGAVKEIYSIFHCFLLFFGLVRVDCLERPERQPFP